MALIVLVAAGCDSDSVPEGSEGGACYPNKTCNEGLTCASKRCVDADEHEVLPPECAERSDCPEGTDGGPAGGADAGDAGSRPPGASGNGGGRAGTGASAGRGAAGAGGTSAGEAGSGQAGAAGAGTECSESACLPVPCGGAACDRPPPSVCLDDDTLRTFAFQGACSGTSCAYPPADSSCPNGCLAGVCQNPSQTLHPWAGLYRGTYSGTDSGTILSVTAPDGAVTVYANSTLSGMQVYTGRIDANGAFAVNGMLGGSVAITFSGSMTGVGPNRMGSGTWSTPGLAASGSWMVDEINPWAGEYTGTFAGSLSGPLHVTVTDDGAVMADAAGLIFTGAVRIDGTLDITGTLDGGLVVGYSGRMSGVAPNRAGIGTWSSTGLSGTWMTSED